MEKGSVEGLFHQYKGLIRSAAWRFSSHTIYGIEFDDMFQDGCMMMLEFFDGRAHTEDPQVHGTFKKSLFLWMLRTRNRSVKKARPTGRTMVRLSVNGAAASYSDSANYPFHSDDNSDGSVDLDRMLGTIDTCVLMKMYAKEFVAELRRMLTGLDLTIFDVMTGSTDHPGKCGDVVREVTLKSGMSSKVVYDRIQHIRRKAKVVLSRSA